VPVIVLVLLPVDAKTAAPSEPPVLVSVSVIEHPDGKVAGEVVIVTDFSCPFPGHNLLNPLIAAVI
jgi:hypothetical protein